MSFKSGRKERYIKDFSAAKDSLEKLRFMLNLC